MILKISTKSFWIKLHSVRCILFHISFLFIFLFFKANFCGTWKVVVVKCETCVHTFPNPAFYSIHNISYVQFYNYNVFRAFNFTIFTLDMHMHIHMKTLVKFQAIDSTLLFVYILLQSFSAMHCVVAVQRALFLPVIYSFHFVFV